MSSTSSPQRRWQALCPGCGAPVEFASAASASAVCSFCRSTLVRDGEALQRIGVTAELFDDHSPLQLGVTGRHQGVGFTLVGRQQFRYAQGTWSEWHVLFDGEAGKSAWLSEDNGAYALSFERPAPVPPPAPASLAVGQRTLIAGDAWRVASLQQASLIAAEGELPRPPRLTGEFWVADLRLGSGEVGTLEWSTPGPPLWSVGRGVGLADLALKGLRQGVSEATLQGRTLPCPSCGATLNLTLASTRSVTCGQCRAVVDVQAGVGGELAFFAQRNSGASGRGPDLPLGRSGRLAVGPEGELDWQVVGFQERCSLPEDDDDEREFWREYLIYHRQAGFAFLVQGSGPWSVVRPVTGAPAVGLGDAQWDGRTYRRREGPYTATTTWVQGEFYWQVRQGDRVQVTDYATPDGQQVLSVETSANEEVWSAGRQLPHAAVMAAFGVTPKDSASPASGRPAAASGGTGRSGGLGGLSQGLIILVVVIVVMLLMARCDGSESRCEDTRQTFGESSAEYQQCLRSQRSSGGSGSSGSGSSFGGFSSGGSHK